MSINQSKYTRESNGIEQYNFVYPEAEIQRNEIHKTVKFSGIDAHLYYANFGRFLNRYLNNKFIAHRSIPIRKKGGWANHFLILILELIGIFFNQYTHPLN